MRKVEFFEGDRVVAVRAGVGCVGRSNVVEGQAGRVDDVTLWSCRVQWDGDFNAYYADKDDLGLLVPLWPPRKRRRA